MLHFPKLQEITCLICVTQLSSNRRKEKTNDKAIQEKESAEEDEIIRGGEIMELANPEDEQEEPVEKEEQ